MFSRGVEEWGLFLFIEIENIRLVQKNNGCNFTENLAIMPRLEKYQVRLSLRNESLNYVSTKTSKK